MCVENRLCQGRKISIFAPVKIINKNQKLYLVFSEIKMPLECFKDILWIFKKYDFLSKFPGMRFFSVPDIRP